MKDFKELKVWEKAHSLALLVYQETRCFPKEERYGLTSQPRRAAGSVAANIVEGCGRR
jgi:four helix bundle protein